MKYSIVAASAMATMALAKPAFTNLSFDIVEGEPFTLGFAGCDTGCTILLQTGQEGQAPVQELSSSASGDSLTITLSDIPSGEYYFRIVNNETEEDNYSETFPFEGTGEATTTSAGTSSAAETSASSVETTSSEESSSTRSTTTVSSTTVTTASSSVTTSASASESASSTTSEEPSSTTSGAASTTTPPDDAAGSLGSSLNLVLGVAAVVALL